MSDTDTIEKIINELKKARAIKQIILDTSEEEYPMWKEDYTKMKGWIEGVNYAIAIIEKYRKREEEVFER